MDIYEIVVVCKSIVSKQLGIQSFRIINEQ